MELEQFKNLWRLETVHHKKDEQLLSFLQRRSNKPIARMKRNLLFELIAVILSYGFAIVYYFFAFQGRMSEVSWFMIGIALFFFVYYFRKNKLLSQMECISCQVRSNLQRQVSTLEKYVRFYLIAGTALIPLTILFFSWLIYVKSPLKPNSVFFHSTAYAWWQTSLAWIAVVCLSTILVYYLNKWYVAKLYGNHIRKLKELLAE